MARGRKSAISMAVVPPVLPGERPAPPAELDGTEERIWRAIVGALPPTWLDAAAQQILVRAVALAAQHAAAGKSLSHLLGVLRATPRARMVPRGASRQIAQVPRVRPWEASDG